MVLPFRFSLGKEAFMILTRKDGQTTLPALEEAIRQHLRYSLGKDWPPESSREVFNSLALTVRDRLVDRMIATEQRYQQADAKRLYYLSMEFLMGRALANNLTNLCMDETARSALTALGADWDAVQDSEDRKSG